MLQGGVTGRGRRAGEEIMSGEAAYVRLQMDSKAVAKRIIGRGTSDLQSRQWEPVWLPDKLIAIRRLMYAGDTMESCRELSAQGPELMQLEL